MNSALTGRFALKLFFSLFLLSVPGQAGAELVLVENGVSKAPVVVFDGAPPMTRLAADDLADYIEKISGARPAVLEGLPDPLPERAIWVGYQPVLDELFPELDFDFEHPEEILLAAGDNHLVIAGRDRWDPDNLRVEGRAYQFGRDTVHVDGFQYEYGTLNAVYTFLHDYLGVRLLWPGEEDIPARETIAVESFDFRYHPRIRMRHSMFFATAPYRSGQPGRHQWNRFNRVQKDSLYAPSNHAFDRWWERFHETNPDYFALQPDGTRSGFPEPRYAKICESNPAVWEQWLKDVEEAIAEHPTRRVFSAAAGDSWMAGHCICDNCLAWDHPEGPPAQFVWDGISQAYVALSDRQVTFANHLGRLLRERFPGREYYVAILAYGNSRTAPVEAVPDDNVIIIGVHGFFHDLELSAGGRFPLSSEEVRAHFTRWSEMSENLIWRPNLGDHGGWRTGGPGADLERIAEVFRLLSDTDTLGIYLDNTWFYWATQGPAYYLMAQLAWNPLADAQAVMDDYFRRGFGPAGELVQEYYELLGSVYRVMVGERREWIEAFDDEILARAARLLDRAEEMLVDAPEKYARRLALVDAGREFLRLQTENRALVPALREAGDRADAEDLARARDNWEAIQDLARKHQPLIWHTGYGPGRIRAVADPDAGR